MSAFEATEEVDDRKEEGGEPTRFARLPTPVEVPVVVVLA